MSSGFQLKKSEADALTKLLPLLDHLSATLTEEEFATLNLLRARLNNPKYYKPRTPSNAIHRRPLSSQQPD
jgi:hypothetical protein